MLITCTTHLGINHPNLDDCPFPLSFVIKNYLYYVTTSSSQIKYECLKLRTMYIVLGSPHAVRSWCSVTTELFPVDVSAFLTCRILTAFRVVKEPFEANRPLSEAPPQSTSLFLHGPVLLHFPQMKNVKARLTLPKKEGKQYFLSTLSLKCSQKNLKQGLLSPL